MPTVLSNLGIDWRLFLAQLVNFAIVLFVLWKWVFTPIAIVLEKRRQGIAKGLEDAKAAAHSRTEAEAKAEATLAAARREAQRVIEEANKTAEAARVQAKETAKAEVAKVVAEGKASLVEEKEQMVRDARAEMAELVVATAAKAIGATLDEKGKRAMLDGAVKKMLAE